MSNESPTKLDQGTASDDASGRPPTTPLWVLALTLATFATGTDDMVIAGLLPWLSSDLGVSVSVTGQLVTAYALVFGLGAPVLAVLTARTPKHPLLLISVALFAVVNVAMALAPNFAVLLGLRVLAAAIAALIVPTALSLVASLAPEQRRGRWLSMVIAGITLSLIAGVPLGTWIAAAFDWRATMLFVAGLSSLAAAGMTRLPRPDSAAGLTDSGAEEPSSLRRRLAPLTRPAVLSVSVSMVIAGSGGMMGYIYLAPIFAHLTGKSPSALALLILIYGMAGFAGVLLGGRGADAIGPGKTLSIGFGVAAAMAALLAVLANALPPGSVPFGVLAVVTGFWAAGLWSFSPPLQSWLLARASGMETAVLALNTSGMYLGFALAGATGGGVLARWGAAAVPVTATCLLAFGGVALAASIRLTERRERSQHADR